MIVHGWVQGVFFRDTCRRKASAAGVAGWVRNTSEGTVEAVFEGSPSAVAQMCTWCRSGPSGATVERVELGEEEPSGLSGFEIRG